MASHFEKNLEKFGTADHFGTWVEDIATFIIDLLTEQKKGNLPYDLLFIWDSVGSIPCDMSINQGKNNPTLSVNWTTTEQVPFLLGRQYLLT